MLLNSTLHCQWQRCRPVERCNKLIVCVYGDRSVTILLRCPPTSSLLEVLISYCAVNVVVPLHILSLSFILHHLTCCRHHPLSNPMMNVVMGEEEAVIGRGRSAGSTAIETHTMNSVGLTEIRSCAAVAAHHRKLLY